MDADTVRPYRERVADIWWQHEAVVFDPRGYSLRGHKQDPEAPLSPFYLRGRDLRSSPRAIREMALAFQAMLAVTNRGPFDRYADVPTGVTPVVTVLCQLNNIGQLTPHEPKTHGTGGIVDGVYQAGKRVSLFDDVLSSGASLLDALRRLRQAGLEVGDAYLLFDRDLCGRERLETEGVRVHSLWGIEAFWRYSREKGYVSAASARLALDYPKVYRDYLASTTSRS